MKYISYKFLKSNFFLFFKIWPFIKLKRKKQICILIFLMTLGALAELFALGSIIPFLEVLKNPENIFRFKLMNILFKDLELANNNTIIIFTAFLFSIAIIISSALRLFNIWVNGRFSAAIGSELSQECFEKILYQPYFFHLQKNSSELITYISRGIGVTVSAISSILNLFLATTITISIALGLVFLNWRIAISLFLIFGSSYVLIGILNQMELKKNGSKISIASKQFLEALQEGLGAIKDVILENNQKVYSSNFMKADILFRKLKAKTSFLSLFPRYFLEALGIVTIAIMGTIYTLNSNFVNESIAILGFVAISAQRLLPALQQIYYCWATLESSGADLKNVLEILRISQIKKFQNLKPLEFKKELILKNVYFKYSDNEPYILENFNYKINHGEKIGIIGKTGSGKSTTIDIIISLLEPTSGEVLVDGKNIFNNDNHEYKYSWRKNIAHVPQGIYLVDKTIAENIAFGLDYSQIDFRKLREAAKNAQILDFINNAPQGFRTRVGERGVQLSGGQRQRIGLARAFYKKADLLILDEATSALDNETEKELINEINTLGDKITLIMIAHRTSTLKCCDKIIKIDNGRIIDSGKPEDILL